MGVNGERGVAMDSQMSDAAIGQELLRLMRQDGIALTEDIHQCELAVLSWIRRAGTATLQEHLGGKKAGVRGVQAGVWLPCLSEVCWPPGANLGDPGGTRSAGAGLLSLPELR